MDLKPGQSSKSLMSLLRQGSGSSACGQWRALYCHWQVWRKASRRFR